MTYTYLTSQKKAIADIILRALVAGRVRTISPSRTLGRSHCRLAASSLTDRDWVACSLGLSESAERRLSGSIRAELVVEAGANIGVLMNSIVSRSHRPSEYIALEPNPATFKDLKRNAQSLSQKHGTKITTINCALAGFDGQVQLLNAASTRGQRVVANSSDDQAQVCESISLSSLLELVHNSEFALILDIEGAEHEVLSQVPSLEGCAQILIEVHATDEFPTPAAASDHVRDALARHGLAPSAASGNVFLYEKSMGPCAN